VRAPVELEFPALDKKLQLRITFPETADTFPIIVFSHGGRCSRDAYRGLAEHWASHGYVVIQPAHLDSSSVEIPAKFRGAQLMVEADRTRRLDVRFIVDSLPALERTVPGLAGKPDAARLIAAGHSLGGGTAMTVTGLVLQNPRDGLIMGAIDNRFKALLLITDPSNNPMMPEEPWRAVALPTFIATGSRDLSTFARRVKRDAGFRFAPGVVMADTPNHYLFIDGMDHYLGGLICRSNVPGAPDYEALRIINGASVAFLNAYIKSDTDAIAFLNAAPSPGLSEREFRLENR
jgi:predicted dienelactone hydrolase